MLNIVISGVVTGLLFALVGQSMVIVYRTTKVLNFAVGGQGIIVAYLAYEMLQRGISYWVVFPTAIVIGAVLGAVIERLIVYPLRRQPVLTIAIATLGVLLALEGIVMSIWGPQQRGFPRAFADSGGMQIGDLDVNVNQIFIIVVGVIATGLMLWLMEKTKVGLGMRATSSGPLTASILGVNVSSMRLSSWIIGGAYGAIAALLVIPLTFLSPTGFVSFLLTAIAAVVLGGFTNIVGVVIGSIIYGICTNMLMAYGQNDLVATFTFVSVALVLLLKPNGIFGKPEKELTEPDIINRRPRSILSVLSRRRSSEPAPTPALTPKTKRIVGSIGWIIALVAAAIVPFVAGPSAIYTVGIIFATYIAVVGLNVVTGYSGEVSLASSGLALIGAYAFAIGLREGLPLPVAIVLALVASGVVGGVIGLFAARVSGIYLVVLTLLFAFIVPELISKFGDFTGGIDGIPVVVKGFIKAEAQYWLVLGLAVIVTAVTLWLASGRVGRDWRSVRDSPNGARALGLDPSRVKLGAFVYGSALAGLAGALTVFLTAFVGPESFAVFWAIYVLLAVVIGGAGSIGGSLIGAAFIVWVPRTADGALPIPLIFGLALIVVLMIAPSGVAGLFQRLTRSIVGNLTRRRASEPRPLSVEDVSSAGATGVVRLPKRTRAGSPTPDAAETARRAPSMTEKPDAVRRDPAPETHVALAASDRRIKVEQSPEVTGALLSLDGLSTGYGAGLVLRGLSLHVQPREVVTLLGANGAGKSTALRAISGLLPALSGSIRWQDSQIGAHGLHTPSSITRSGLAHVPEGRGVFPDLAVLENLRLGLFADTQQSKATFEERLEAVFGYFPILKERLKQDGGTLSGGEQQMLAIGRALMGAPKLLMLDEPSLGLSPLYSQQVLDNLRRIVDDGDGVSVLLIEQNARAALDRSDRAYVLSRGSVVLEGTPDQLRTEHDLSELYLAVET